MAAVFPGFKTLKPNRLGNSCINLLKEMKPGNYVIGYFEEGIHSNREQRLWTAEWKLNLLEVL